MASWACSACTFENFSATHARFCEICHTPRPNSPATQSSSGAGGDSLVTPWNMPIADLSIPAPNSELMTGESSHAAAIRAQKAQYRVARAARAALEVATSETANTNPGSAGQVPDAADDPVAAWGQLQAAQAVEWRDAIDQVADAVATNANLNWHLVARTLKFVHEQAGSDDAQIVKFMDTTFDKLQRRWLDLANSRGDKALSWKAMEEQWNRLDQLARDRSTEKPNSASAGANASASTADDSTTRTLPGASEKEHGATANSLSGVSNSEQGSNGQGSESSASVPVAVPPGEPAPNQTEATAEESSSSSPPSEPIPDALREAVLAAGSTGVFAAAFEQAWRDIVCHSVSIIVQQLAAGNSTKLGILDAVLDPESRRYHHQSFNYSGAGQAWNSGATPIGAPHLHDLALKTFLTSGGMDILDNTLESSKSAAAALGALLPVSKNLAKLWKAHADEMHRLLQALLRATRDWDGDTLLGDTQSYSRLLETLYSIEAGRCQAASVTLSEEPDGLPEGEPTINPSSEVAIAIAERFVHSNKLRFRRFGLEQLGKAAQALVSRLKVPRTVVTAYLKSRHLFHDVFGERMDERVVSVSEELLKNSALDFEILDLILNSTNSRAMRKLLTSLFLFPVFTEDLICHLLVQCSKRAVDHGDVGSFKLVFASLAGETYLKQAIIRKGPRAHKASLGALWSLLFCHALHSESEKRGNVNRDAPSLELSAGQLDDLLAAFVHVAKSAPADLRRRFADRCLFVVWQSKINNGGSEAGPRADANDDSGFFEVDEDEEDVSAAALSRPVTPCHPIDIGEEEGADIAFASPEAALVAHKIFRQLVLSCSDEVKAEHCERQEFVSELDHTWNLKLLFLNELDAYLSHCALRARADAMDQALIELFASALGVGRGDEQMEEVAIACLPGRNESDEAWLASCGSRRVRLEGQMWSAGTLFAASQSVSQELVRHQAARLLTISCILKASHGHIEMTADDMSRVWAACCLVSGEIPTRTQFLMQERFMLWLRVVTFDSRRRCIPPTISRFVLEVLFSEHLLVGPVGPKTYHCLQAHFVDVNCECGFLEASDCEAVADEFKFKSSPPPPGLEGTNLVGRRVFVLFGNGTMVKGKVVRYVAWSNKHVLEYVTGLTEEKELGLLKEWQLLPPIDAASAGSVHVKSVENIDLLGIESLWAVAILNKAKFADVAAQAFHLLLNLHASARVDRANCDQFLSRVFQALSSIVDSIAEHDDHHTTRLYWQRAWRCLSYLRSYTAHVESLDFAAAGFTLPRNYPLNLGALGFGWPIDVQIESSIPVLDQLWLKVHSKSRVAALLRILADHAEVEAKDLVITIEADELGEISLPPHTVSLTLASGGVASLVLDDIGLSAVSEQIKVSVDLAKTKTEKGAGAKDSADLTTLKIVPYTGAPAQATANPATGPNQPGDMTKGGDQGQESVGAINGAGEHSTSTSASNFEESEGSDDAAIKLSCLQEALDAAVSDASLLAQMDFQQTPGGRVSASEYADLLIHLLELCEPTEASELVQFVRELPCFLHLVEELELQVNSDLSKSRDEFTWVTIYKLQLLGALVLSEPRNGNSPRFPAAGNPASLLPSRDAFLESRAPLGVVRLFNQLCGCEFKAKPAVARTAFPWICRAVCDSFEAVCLYHEGDDALLPAAEGLLELILCGRDYLEAPGGCTCFTPFLGAGGFSGDSSKLSVAERSRVPPAIPGELASLQQPVCARCLEARHVAKAILTALQTLAFAVERSPELGSVLFGASAKTEFGFGTGQNVAGIVLRKLVLYCSYVELRQGGCEFLVRTASASQEFEATVAGALRDVERELEAHSGLDTSTEFFRLFLQFVPSPKCGPVQEDFELVQRIVALVLDWPDRPFAGLQHLSADTHLFVMYVDTLRHMLETHEALRSEASRIRVDTEQEGEESLIRVLWNDYLMDYMSPQPACQSADARAAVGRLLSTLAKQDLDSILELLELLDNFSAETPAPLREADRGRDNVPDWNFSPVPSGATTSVFQGRNETGFVGLRNRGSTCYQNSLLQLLFHIPRFRAAILQAPVAPPTELNTSAKSGGDGEQAAQEVKVVIGWMCRCSGRNDLDATLCHICFSPKSDKAETISETFAVGPDKSGGNGATPAVSSEAQSLEVLRQLQRTFRFLQDSRKGCYDPIPFVEACASLNLTFPVTSQNDASEFFDKLLDNLESSLADTPFLSVMKNCFLGNQTRLKRCHVCGVVSVSREESFYRFELMTKDNSVEKCSLEECLASFVAPEVLTGDNKVDCDHCKARAPCTFVSCLTCLPDFLFIHPKRFAFDLVTMQTVKLNHLIKFPRRLDLFSFTRTGQAVQARARKADGRSASSSSGPANRAQNSGLDEHAFWVDGQPLSDEEVEQARDECQYVLAGVLVHRGRAGGGHYYSFRQAGPEGEWFKFDDARVSRFDPDTGLAHECFGGSYDRTTTNTWGTNKVETHEKEWSAFMLLYERVHHLQPAEFDELEAVSLASTPITTPFSPLQRMPFVASIGARQRTRSSSTKLGLA